MLQKKDDKKHPYEPFKLRSTMIELDKYLRIFVLPQIPAEHKEFRDLMQEVMDRAWRTMFYAAMTKDRERQRRLMELKVEMMMLNVYLEEVREVCYRGKARRQLDKVSARRFAVCAERQREVMEIIWGWIENESKKMNPARTQKTAGLKESEA